MTTEELKTALQEKLQIAFETTREMFFAMDTRKVGTITKQDFLKTFQRLGLFPREKQVGESRKFSRISYFVFRIFVKHLISHLISRTTEIFNSYSV